MKLVISIAILLFVVTTIVAKKKDVRDFSDADMERLYQEWEENDDEEIPEDEKPDYEKKRPDIDIEELKQKARRFICQSCIFLLADFVGKLAGRFA